MWVKYLTSFFTICCLIIYFIIPIKCSTGFIQDSMARYLTILCCILYEGNYSTLFMSPGIITHKYRQICTIRLNFLFVLQFIRNKIFHTCWIYNFSGYKESIYSFMWEPNSHAQAARALLCGPLFFDLLQL